MACISMFRSEMRHTRTSANAYVNEHYFLNYTMFVWVETLECFFPDKWSFVEFSSPYTDKLVAHDKKQIKLMYSI